MKRRKHDSKEEPEHPQQEMDIELRQEDFDRILDNAIQSTSRTIMRKGKRKIIENAPQLSSAQHELIFDSALDQSKVMMPKHKQTMNPTLRQYLSTNKVLIKYVWDVNGYPKGLVVATAKDKIGWSLVSTRDISLQRMDPVNIPVLKRLIEERSPIAEIVKHKAYKKCIKDHSSVTVPTFDRDTGFLIALGRSLISKLEDKDGKLFLEPAPAHDPELKAAISRMAVRAKRYFK